MTTGSGGSSKCGALRLTLCALLLVGSVWARIHNLKVRGDSRYAFSIESFGFYEGGTVSVHVRHVDATPEGEHRMGFVMYPSSTESKISEQIDILIIQKQCALDAKEDEGVYKIDVSDPKHWDSEKPLEVTIGRPGLYDLLFTHCTPIGAKVTFEAEIVFLNPGNNYLSAGEQPLPTLYGIEALAFFISLVAWLRYTRVHAAEMHKVHHLMTLLLLSKALALACEAAMYHYISTTGHSTGWNIAFYIATFMRGTLMIAVIALIGAGWSLLRPFLTDREKKLLAVALPLQVAANIAVIVTDEMAPGSIGYSMWFMLLKSADLIAAAIVLLPIYWSIKTLKSAQLADVVDEKARNTLVRLTTFRSFYVITIAYIYFTRIIVYILVQTVPYTRQWVAPFCEETATLIFYLWAGYRFRPAADNSDYLSVPTDDDVAGVIAADAEAAAAGVDVNAPPTDVGAASQTSGTSTRMVSATQTVARVKAVHVDVDGERRAKALARASGGGPGVAIADDDKDDEDFGLDDDDPGFSAPPAAVMKHVNKS